MQERCQLGTKGAECNPKSPKRELRNARYSGRPGTPLTLKLKRPKDPAAPIGAERADASWGCRPAAPRQGLESQGKSSRHAVRARCHPDVRQLGKRPFRKPLRFIIHEGARHEPGTQVRSGCELERCRAGNRIHGVQKLTFWRPAMELHDVATPPADRKIRCSRSDRQSE